MEVQCYRRPAYRRDPKDQDSPSDCLRTSPVIFEDGTRQYQAELLDRGRLVLSLSTDCLDTEWCPSSSSAKTEVIRDNASPWFLEYLDTRTDFLFVWLNMFLTASFRDETENYWFDDDCALFREEIENRRSSRFVEYSVEGFAEEIEHLDTEGFQIYEADDLNAMRAVLESFVSASEESSSEEEKCVSDEHFDEGSSSDEHPDDQPVTPPDSL